MGWLEYYKKWIKLAFPRPWFLADSLAGFIAICAGLIVKFNPPWEVAMIDLAWQIPLAVFVGLTGWRIIVSPYWIHQEIEKENQQLKEQIRDNQAVSLEILFDPTQSTYITPDFAMHRKHFRVCVKNTSMKTAENVTVELTSISPWPRAKGMLPVPLREKDAAEPYSSSFKINPQSRKFVDVLTVVPVFGKESASGVGVAVPHFQFCSAGQEIPWIPVVQNNSYKITIEVTGDGTIGNHRNFGSGSV